MRFRFGTLVEAIASFTALLLVLGLPVRADAGSITLQGASGGSVSNCSPFGGSSAGTSSTYKVFVYKNVPAFTLHPGDTLAFDTANKTNDYDVIMDVAVAQASSNGSTSPIGAFTQVVTNGTSPSRGDLVQGTYEIQFNVDSGVTWSFPGGGLLVRFLPKGSFTGDTSCTSNLVWSRFDDPNPYFVAHVVSDADGAPPWDTAYYDKYIGHIRISTQNEYYPDVDEDGDGDPDPAGMVLGGTAPAGYVESHTDCDDNDDTVYGGAPETCDGVDDDCDSSIDEGLAYTAYYLDGDGDEYGDEGDLSPLVSCEPTAPAGRTADNTDCDDGEININPGAEETCNDIDDDCDGTTDLGIPTYTYFRDVDLDTYGDVLVTVEDCDPAPPGGYVANDEDCDDSDAFISPAGIETCDGVDDDCDDIIDDGVTLTFYADSDSDLFGDATTETDACAAPLGYVADGTDCDDGRDDVNPAAPETCDGVDNNCTGDESDAVGAPTWYADVDGDDFGDPANDKKWCTQPDGYLTDTTDCDDTDPSAHPGGTEVAYDGIDQDCSGADWDDVDGDSFAGGPSGSDCVDIDSTIHPGVAEIADGVDQDCDGVVDETTQVYDDDGDGFADFGGDCDDGVSGVSPAADETCNGIDDDCDETIDEETECSDEDGDGYTEDDGDCNDDDSAVAPGMIEDLFNGIDDDCDGIADGTAYDGDGDGYGYYADCDDSLAESHPGAPEIPDGEDNDCDEIVDEGTVAYDDDGDGYSEDDGDCNDHDADQGPEGTETLNGIDDDCDGVLDEGSVFSDDDGDGLSEEQGDCDDSTAEVNLGSEEQLNGVDDDCDGSVDEGLVDVDEDGFTADDGDCDDENGWRNPGMDELCGDAVDNDCNGVVDDGACADELTGGSDPTCACSSGASAGWITPVLALLIGARRRSRAMA